MIRSRPPKMAMASALQACPRLVLCHHSTKALASKRNGFCPSSRLPGTRDFVLRGPRSYGSFASTASMLERKAEKRETVIPDPDYKIPIVLLGLAGGFLYQENLLPAATLGLLGLLLLVQANRVRFVFDEEALEVRIGEQLEESGENVFVGGKNRWNYSNFVNWELWWPNFPILVYFKETQTKPQGQIHFFPVIFNGKQLYNVMLERAGPSKTSMPK
ncbi:uncharacterized protein LOC110033125 isoform X2 [Phalaenopsis equestris]|uniref:uncharacterized protein LOC110033125 isoform X2 n=1 Tax=Phalaenopsis equestris TaxID=78828 RepID=UPI0009E4EAA9|nr:uncharacterized protein LOC110033125 isoform X2 [Phalaenopsis equestris]